MARGGTGIVVGLVLLCSAAGALRASPQDAPPGTSAFDIASVRANHSGTTQSGMNRTPGGVAITNLPLRAIIQFAYGVQQPSRLIGAPGWIVTERFDIVARGTTTSLDDFRAKMQTLLADRFKLAAHMEARSGAVFKLVRARQDGQLGPSLKPSSRTCAPLGGRGRGGQASPESGATTGEFCGPRPGGPGEFDFVGVPIDLFASLLSLSQGRPVIDSTELSGNYDIHLLFAPDPIPGRALDPATEGRPSLYTALQEQLGLKLEAANAPQDVLVIDSVSRPDEN